MKTYSLLLALALTASATHAQDLLKQFPVKGAPASGSAPRKAGTKSIGKLKGTPQAAVAAKGAFPTIKASDPSLKTAVVATNLPAAKKLVGKNVLVVGVVSDVFAPRSGSITLINFAKNYKTAVVGAVKAKDFAKFPNLMNLKGKKVALRGTMISFKGQPEVELTTVGAIRIVK